MQEINVAVGQPFTEASNTMVVKSSTELCILDDYVAHLEKCGFFMSTIEYLGLFHVIGNGRMKPYKRKVEAVTQFKTPTNVHEVRQYIGLASYFRKLIKNFASGSANNKAD